MKDLFDKVFKIINWLSTITGIIGAICIFIAALIITEGVLARKIFGASTYWQIEASVFLLIYACFMGAPYAQKNNNHLNVDLVIIHISPKKREFVLLCVSIITCMICIFLAYFGWKMWWKALITRENTGTIWAAPLWIPYLFLPLGMTLMFLQYIVQIVEKFKKLVKKA